MTESIKKLTQEKRKLNTDLKHARAANMASAIAMTALKQGIATIDRKLDDLLRKPNHPIRLNFVLDVENIDIIEIDDPGKCPTRIPLKGQWDGSGASASQFRGIRLDLGTNDAAMKFLDDREEAELVIYATIKRKTGDGSWNMNVYREE